MNWFGWLQVDREMTTLDFLVFVVEFIVALGLIGFILAIGEAIFGRRKE